jgi:omega-amidase
MRITLVQSDLIWEDRDKNISKFSSVLSTVYLKTDLVVLPEMFTTGFSMNSGTLGEPFPGPTFNWMKEESERGNFCICGSYIAGEGNDFYNRLLFFKPNGEFRYYDKRHLFGIGGENEYYKRGKEQVIVNHKYLRINLLICYDLRFPVWSRNRGDYDVLLYVANWPQSRREVWSTLLKARAIENQCFVVGVNRIGKDGEGITYSGDSMIIDPKGNVILSLNQNEEDLKTFEISLSDLKEFRSKFPVWKDADDFIINTDSDL